MKFLITIVKRGLGDKICQMLRQEKVLINYINVGKGTVDDSILNYLGIETTDKDIVFSVVRSDQISHLFKIFQEQFHFDQAGRGIAFTVPIESIGNNKVIETIMGGK